MSGILLELFENFVEIWRQAEPKTSETDEYGCLISM